MIEPSEAIGLIVGSAGLIVAVYSMGKQKRLEKRFKEKEKLKALSEKILFELDFRIDSILEEIENPMLDENIYFDLKQISEMVVARAFDQKSDLVSLNIEMEIDLDDTYESIRKDQQNIMTLSPKNEKQFLKLIADEKYHSPHIYCFLDSNDLLMELSEVPLGIELLLRNMEEVESEFGTMINEFKPELFINLKNSLMEMLETIAKSVILSNEIAINIKDFDRTEEIGLWIYDTALGKPHLTEHLFCLSELKKELDDFREKLIATSYT
ncbi:putative membrane protein [Methanohalophilus levihalophilus]|uniref:hypothetical protein n=1 Tax=Methanohalophilus levihalophilus TaxID=1431282 RepID=UPI001AEAABF4|nr:hypothetical protein [Methanohalophilus levihalophilus]MBP2030089.1 putative membrane protein [Methanohalophilus levihalophilus]